MYRAHIEFWYRAATASSISEFTSICCFWADLQRMRQLPEIFCQCFLRIFLSIYLPKFKKYPSILCNLLAQFIQEFSVNLSAND